MGERIESCQKKAKVEDQSMGYRKKEEDKRLSGKGRRGAKEGEKGAKEGEKGGI
jgi:hypothetical protein